MCDHDNNESTGEISPVPCREVYIVEFTPAELIPMYMSAGSEIFDVFWCPK